MKDFTQKLKDGLSKTSEVLKTSSEEAFTKIKEGAELISSIGPAAKDKVVDMVNEVIMVLPLLEKAGYRTNEFEIGMSLTPTIEITFAHFKEVSEEELAALKEEHKDKKMFNMILGMLNTSAALSGKLKTNEFKFQETVIEISIPPKVSLKYVRK